jgi:predicted TIM-barrel fold metal-dependent hydrolase
MAEARIASGAEARLPLVDCDVHEDVRSPEILIEYLPSGWQEHARLEFVEIVGATKSFSSNPWGYFRQESIPDDGGPAGSSRALLTEQLLDGQNVTTAVLTGAAVPLGLTGLTNPHFAQQLARAVNDHRVEHWLDADSRFKGSIAVPLQVPEWAAAEVYRVADREDFVQVLAHGNPHRVAFGHPLFDPLHKACAETDRALAIHALGEAIVGGVDATAGGDPSFYIEFHSAAVQAMMTHTMSFIFHGVFERYPNLTLMLLEPGGVAWIPGFLQRLDAEFKGLRREVPWCKRLPSEYFMEHIRVATQPFDHERSDDQLLAVLDGLGAADFLVFATDYPHWDADDPARTLRAMPPKWRANVAYGNAARVYGLDVEVAA